MRFVVKTGKDLKALVHRQESVEERTNSGVDWRAEALRRQEGLGERIHHGLGNITLSERSQTPKATYCVV